MNQLRLVLLCLSLGACKTVTSPPVVEVATDCGSPALRDIAVHLLDDVTSALLSGSGWQGALAGIAARAGADGVAAVKCAVAEVLTKTDVQLTAKASMGPSEAARTQTLHDNALAYLAVP